MERKGIFALILATVVGFVLAFSLCVETLSHREVFAVQSSLKILIDAGHGGIDGGVTGKKTGIKESDLNLKIALLTAEKLTRSGYAVALTRKTKEGLYDTTAKGFKKRAMQKRKEIMEREDPDLFLSIHQNFFPASGERGGQVFYLKGDDEDERFSSCLQEKLNLLYAPYGVKGRKIMPADFFVLAHAPCPSALIECGFLSSEKDEKLLTDDAFLGRLAQGILDGINEYLFSLA